MIEVPSVFMVCPWCGGGVVLRTEQLSQRPRDVACVGNKGTLEPGGRLCGWSAPFVDEQQVVE